MEYCVGLVGGTRGLDDAGRLRLFKDFSSQWENEVNSFLFDECKRTIIIRLTGDSNDLCVGIDGLTSGNLQSTLLVLKNQRSIDYNVPVRSQFSVVWLSDSSMIDSLTSLIDDGLSTVIDLLIKQESGPSDSLRMTKSKLKNVSYTLHNMQYTICTPEIVSMAHPRVQDLVKEGKHEADFESTLLKDSNFLNALQSIVNQWLELSRGLCDTDRDVRDGSAYDEIQFWSDLQKSLMSLAQQLRSPEVRTTMSILVATKRWNSVSGFVAETGVTDRLKIVSEYNQFISSIPLKVLSSAEKVEDVIKCIDLLASALKKFRFTSFPEQRFALLMSKISQEVHGKLLEVIPNLFTAADEDFENYMRLISVALVKWNDTIQENKIQLREVIRRRGHSFSTAIDIRPNAEDLQESLKQLSEFRDRHAILKASLETIRYDGYFQDLEFLFEPIGTLPNTSIASWAKEEALYRQRLSVIEEKLIVVWRTALDRGSSSEEMINQYAIFAPLMASHPKLRSVMRDCQEGLLSIVKEEITALSLKVEGMHQVEEVLLLKGLTPITAFILQCLQIRDRILILRKRSSILLGLNWETLPEGKTLSSRFIELTQKTDCTAAFHTWKEKASQLKLDKLDTPMLKVLSNHDDHYELLVNFDFSAGSIFKEVRDLGSMGFNIPNGIIRTALKFGDIQCSASIILEQLQTFLSVVSGLDSRTYTAVLLRKNVDAVWRLIGRATVAVWSNSAVDPRLKGHENTSFNHIKDLEMAVSLVLKDFEVLEESEMLLKRAFEALVNAPSNTKLASEAIASIQSILVGMTTLQFETLNELTSLLNRHIEEIILSKTREELRSMQLGRQALVVTLKGTSLSCSPELIQIKSSWIKKIEQIVTKVAGQPKIHLKSSKAPKETFSSLTDSLSGTVAKVLKRLEKEYQLTKRYLEHLKKTEALWLLKDSDLHDTIRGDITICYNLWEQLANLRDYLERPSEAYNVNGLLIFRFEDSLLQIYGKLDYWQKLLSEVLLALYLNTASSLSSDIRKDLEELEGHDAKFSSFEHLSSLLISVHRMRSYNHERRKTVEFLSLCEPVFLETRLRLPTEYLYIDQLENDMRNAEDCLEEKEVLVETKRALTITVLEDKLTSINSHIRMVSDEWRMKQSLIQEELPEEALNILLNFETSLANIREEVRVVSLCSRIILHPIVIEDCLKKASNEVQDSIMMCKRLKEILKLVDNSMQKDWASANIDIISRDVATIAGTIAGLSSNFRQYKLFEELETKVRKLKGCMGLFKEMKSSAMKSRHWKAIFAKSPQTTPPAAVLESQTFSLKDIVALNIEANEASMKEIIYSARREGVLEESLCRMQSFWKYAQYELFEHSSGMALVKDWISIRQSCSDDLDELISMKNSICFKFFEHDCTDLETKLAAFLEIQHNWMEAQFHWLDLFGVVGEGGKLSSLLPHETAKFQSVTVDLRAISSRAFQMGSIIELTSFSGGKKKFKDLEDQLKVIKTSLTDYLEQQRRNYPRYFFLGNDDLLKLLGTGSDLGQMSRFMPKLFGSISHIQFLGSIITGICSIEGEVLNLDTSVPIEDHLTPDVWLNILELQIKKTISNNVHSCLKRIAEGIDFTSLLYSHSFQVLLLTWQVIWTKRVDRSIEEGEFSGIQQYIDRQLDFLMSILKDCKEGHDKQKVRSLIIECIHGAAIVTKLCNASSAAMVKLEWSKIQKFYYQDDEPNLLERVIAVQCGRQLKYGFTYIGVPERLIYTSTLDRSFAALGEALSQKYGGCLFGPAGTGKTETIKALAQNLGRMVLVFNCDKSFDFLAMSRLLSGITQVGAWGCFDELNRMNETTLSSVTSHVEKIQLALLKKCDQVHLMNQSIPLNADAGLFITFNPGYGGRSVLPENLKKRFREYSVRKAETDTISEVIMRIMGFQKAHSLSKKLVCLFETLRTDCSSQKHYDFGLRSFKKVFKTCAELAGKRGHHANEECLLTESMSQIILPSLNKADEVVFMSHTNRLFSHHESMIFSHEFNQKLLEACKECFIEPTKEFAMKCAQLFNLQRSQQAIILMGPAGFGKTAVWRTTLMAIKKLGALHIFAYVIDTKTLTKNSLYGRLNEATLEWKDGIFTSILRKVNDDMAGTFKDAMVWVVFDSDLDPEYIEVLNSALDDNKLLTLPTGERIAMPQNLRLLFEAPDLDYATPATITRCAIIWFPEPLYADHEQLNCSLTKAAQEVQARSGISEDFVKHMGLILRELLSPVDFSCISAEAKLFHHILSFDSSRTVTAISKIIIQGIRSFHHLLLVAHDKQQYVFTLIRLYQALINAMAADTSSKDREKIVEFVDTIFETRSRELLDGSRPESLCITTKTLEPIPFSDLVEQNKLEPHDVMKPDVFIPTLDTLKQESYVFDLLNAGQPVILCGPPGSGKTMILTNALRKSAQFLLVAMNFSKDTTISSILKSLKRHTIYADGPKGLVLCPKLPDKCVVLFCDEINLPKLDKYGSQSVILFLRLLIEKNGFWRTDDNRWVSIERIRIVGACNPSSDPGRLPLSPRFLRHTPILSIDYPSEQSLMTIYQNLFEATFSLLPHLKSYARTFCDASIYLYHQCKKNFTPSMRAHYLFSPRELTRWIRGLQTAIVSGLQQEFGCVFHAWAYEASRIFADRLVDDADTQVFLTLLRETSKKYFAKHGKLPPDSSELLFSSLLSQGYEQVQKVDLLAFVKQRLTSFAKEQLDSQLIVHEEMLNHILAIDRILKQRQGHAMLIGARRTGKTTLVKFVSWINGLTVLQPGIHKNYDIHEFDAFLRKVLLRCTMDGQRVCLIIDESSILESSFLERMNTLLANSDVPDLFQEEQYETLIFSLRQKIDSLGLVMNSEQELYDWFVGQISKNLHVVFTICDPCGIGSTNLTTSPALFNRCVINWMGSWSTSVLRQISNEIIQSMSLESSIVAPSEKSLLKSFNIHPNKISNAFVRFHIEFHVEQENTKSPGMFLDALKLFKKLHLKKGIELDENQRFFSNGLQKLDESVLKFQEMSALLTTKGKELKRKEMEARQTLDKMLLEQNEAERKQEATLEIKTILTQRESEASQRRQSVRVELDAFEPIMLEAQRGVKNIKKQQLTEIRSMINPPVAVKITIEAVCSVLGYRSSSWRNIQQFIRSDEFIYDIVHFDPDTMLPKDLKMMIENEFLSIPDFTYEKVHRASKACGPLYQWVYAQIKYSEVLDKVGPLRDEAKQIEEEALLAKARLLAAEDMISELEEGIKELKDTYRVIIRDIEVIKGKMEEVQAKLDRSKALVENLSSEKSRWKRYILSYQQELEEMNGNCLITAIYFSYCGVLNEKQRKQTFEVIAGILDGLSIRFDRNYEFVAFNIDVDSQIRWIAHGIPNETFYMENFLLALEPDVIPYIVDPNSQVPQILSSFFDGKLEVISFDERNFVKKLANAVKFGGTVLVQNAENFDPIMNNVLAGVCRKSHGHRIVQIGDLEVDVSPEFRMLLYSNNARRPLSNFVQSRVRVVDFSINEVSVEMQAVRMALTYDVPEIERENEELSKLNGIYKVQLKTFEHQLLEELNQSKGNILENDELITTLERVKAEAILVEGKLQRNQDLMEKLATFITSYSTFGYHCSSLYSMMKKLSRLHWFYELPLWLFVGCLEAVLVPEQAIESDVATRVKSLSWRLYQKVYSTFSAYLTKDYKMVLAIIFHLMFHFTGDIKRIKQTLQSVLNIMEPEIARVHETKDEVVINCSESIKNMIGLIGNQAYFPAIELLANEFPNEETLENMTLSSEKNYIVVASERDIDSSFKVIELANKQKQELSVIALGSPESENYAEQEVIRSMLEGRWVLLQNIQMSMSWVESFLARKLELQPEGVRSPKKRFKIFMTCSLLGALLPLPLLQNSYKKVFESTPSILGSVRDLWSNASLKSENENKGLISAWLIFLLAWFHAIIEARNGLNPIGFSKKYDFNECDFASGLSNIKQFVSRLDDESSLFDCAELHFTIGRIIYGGKIDEDEDLAVLQNICSRIFSPEAIKSLQNPDKSHDLLPGVSIPQGFIDEQVMSDILNNSCEPIDSYSSWLGLPADAIQQYERIKTRELLIKTENLLTES